MESIKPIQSSLQRSHRSELNLRKYDTTSSYNLRNKDLAGLLLSPSVSSLTVNSPNLNTGIPKIQDQRVPSAVEIHTLVNTLVPSKRKSPRHSPSPIPIPDKQVNIPQTKLSRARSGVNTGIWYENDRLQFSAKGAKRYSSRPNPLYSTKSKLFPTNDIEFDKIPQTTSSRFGFINPQEEEYIANFLVNSRNAFKTHWSKHSNMKDRKFYPEMHPEFVKEGKVNNQRRDIITNYRESMLMVKNMMNKYDNKK